VAKLKDAARALELPWFDQAIKATELIHSSVLRELKDILRLFQRFVFALCVLQCGWSRTRSRFDLSTFQEHVQHFYMPIFEIVQLRHSVNQANTHTTHTTDNRPALLNGSHFVYRRYDPVGTVLAISGTDEMGEMAASDYSSFRRGFYVDFWRVRHSKTSDPPLSAKAVACVYHRPRRLVPDDGSHNANC
jgi:hypothetical protein